MSACCCRGCRRPSDVDGGVSREVAARGAQAPEPTAPAQIAKAALRRLTLERLEPTPENYARAYQAERGAAAHPCARQVLDLAVQVVELGPHRSRREKVQVVARFVGHDGSSVVSASPSRCGAASSQLTAI